VSRIVNTASNRVVKLLVEGGGGKKRLNCTGGKLTKKRPRTEVSPTEMRLADKMRPHANRLKKGERRGRGARNWGFSIGREFVDTEGELKKEKTKSQLRHAGGNGSGS